MRIIYICLFLIITASFLLPEIKVIFPFNRTQYTLILTDKKDFKLNEPYNAFKDMEIAHHYRIMFDGVEKSRINTLGFVGDSFEFNNIEIKYSDFGRYTIYDRNEGIKADFRIGEKGSIEILSSFKFSSKEISVIDKIGTAITVKTLFSKLNGSLEEEKGAENLYKKNETQLEKVNAYMAFVGQLKLLDKKSSFNYLKRHINLNFRIDYDPKKAVDFISPFELFYGRIGNHRSLAYFYYYTLKQLGFNVKSYLVSDLKRRDDKDITRIEHMKNSEKEHLEREYRYVKPNYNLEELLNFFPPNFKKTIYIVAMEEKNNWIYTTGDEWISAEVYRPERVCTSYMRKGCYYSSIKNDELYTAPLKEEDASWDVFFDIK